MSDNQPQSHAHEGARYWNEEGGRTWVEYIDTIDSLIVPLSTLSLERARPTDGEVVLDVGCGGGATSHQMAERVGRHGRVTGVDISSTILAVAKERFGQRANLQFAVGDAQTMDLGEGVFDLIYSRFGVMFFQDMIAAFTNLHRALKPSGRLVFLCWRAPEANPWIQRPMAAITEIFPPPPSAGAEAPDSDATGPFALADPERINHVVQSAGFTEVQVEAVDESMAMGRTDDAVSFILGMMGPSADQMALATQEQVTAVQEAIRRIVESYETSDGVCIPCAAWMVSARA